jgi:hypothetical protein
MQPIYIYILFISGYVLMSFACIAASSRPRGAAALNFVVTKQRLQNIHINCSKPKVPILYAEFNYSYSRLSPRIPKFNIEPPEDTEELAHSHSDQNPCTKILTKMHLR